MEEERNYTVYLHVNKSNDKTYVGITCQEVVKRWKSGLGYSNNDYFARAIKKYGWDGFEHIILFENKSKEDAEYLEILFIKILMSNEKEYGYNISNGGNCVGTMSDETKLKISIANKGKKRSKEVILKYKTAQKKLNRIRGKGTNAKKVICDGIIFDCVKDFKDYYNLKNYSTAYDWLLGNRGMSTFFFDKGLKYLDGEDNTREHKDYNIGETCKKKVLCGGIIYESITEASNAYGVSSSSMSTWLTGVNPTPQNFINLGLDYLDEKSNIIPQLGIKGDRNPKSKKVICDGIIYNCITDCAKKYNFDRRKLNDWLANPHRMSQEFKDLGLAYYINEDVQQSA